MRKLSVQAANDTYTSTDRQEIQKEIDQLTSEIDRISATTEFNNKKLLDGSTSALVSSDKLTTKIFMRGGLRVLDQFGQKARGGGNYKLDITADAGLNEVQKTDIFKVKHEQGETKNINTASGTTDFEMTGAPEGTYNVNTVDISDQDINATLNATAFTDTGGITFSINTANATGAAYIGSAGNRISVELVESTANLSV